jgi:REP element-mobilizing transposase RayT
MMAERFWLEIPDHFHHVVLDKYIIMPNHIHGIIKMDYSKTGNLDEDLLNSETCAIGTFHGMSLLNRNKRVYNKFGRPLSGSISVIINQYKSSLKRWCNKNDYRSFAWQTRFYDHIINNRGELYRIRDYIESDPVRQNRNKNIL